MGEFEDKVRAAFDSELKRTPSRPGLRQRVIANAVATPRTRQWWFSTWVTPQRLALVGAAAGVLVVAGIGIRVATQSGPLTAHRTPTPSAQLAFGKLPAPGLHPPQGLGGGGTTPAVVPYFGPATMTWAGTLPSVPSSASVIRFSVPTIAEADAFATRQGGILTYSGSSKEPRTYQLPGGYLMSVTFNDPVAGQPTFNIVSQSAPGGTQPLGEDGARAAAAAELSRRGLTPSWKSTVTVTTLPALINQGPLYAVQYQRIVDVPGGAAVGEVDGDGDPAGIQVVVDSRGKVAQITGVLSLSEQEASYPLRAPSSTVNDALTSPPITHETGPVPTVTLTKATFVYTAITSANLVYLEPAYLFTGTFVEKGTLEKRVLVPAVASNALKP